MRLLELKKYLESLNQVNHIDNVCNIYNDKSLEIDYKVFTRIAIKYINGVKYYITALVIYDIYDFVGRLASVYKDDDELILDICRNFKTFDLTQEEWDYVVARGNALDEVIDDKEFPVVIDGNYDEDDIIILSKVFINNKKDYIILFADATGQLYSVVSNDFVKAITSNRQEFNFYFCNCSSKNNISFKRNKVSIHEEVNGEPFYLSLLWHKGNERLHIDNDYKGLDVATELLEKLIKQMDTNDYLKAIFDYKYIIYGRNEISNKGNILSEVLSQLHCFSNLPILQKCGEFLYPESIISYKNRFISIHYHNLYNEKTHDCSLDILDTLKIDGDILSFKGCYLGSFDLPCVYMTLEYNIKEDTLNLYDIKVFDKNSHYYIPGNRNYNSYGEDFYALTEDDRYMGSEYVDFSTAFITNSSQPSVIKELTAESLSEYLKTLGYHKKERMITPDFCFLETYKSTWLNETDFVNIRCYTKESSKEYILDIYKNGKLLESISGNFSLDIVSNAINFASKNDTSTLLVPKIYATLYKESPFSVFYNKSMFFTEFHSKYDYGSKYGSFHLLVAKYNSNNMYVILLNYVQTCILLPLHYYKDSLEKDGNVFSYYRNHDSNSLCYVLMAFKTEQEAFDAFIALKDAYEIDLDNRNFMTQWLSLITFTDIDTSHLRRYTKQNNVISMIIAKHLNVIQNKSWREILDKIPENIFNTMILGREGR